MSKQSQHNAFVQQAPAEQDVVALIKRMQQQLAFLEKKIDILINQSQTRPFSEKHFSKPFRTSGHPNRRSDREHDTTYGEKSSDRGRHFEKRHGERNHSFGHKRKAYDNHHESEVGQEHHFEKRQGGETRGFEHNKKPFYKKRKDRG
jgi:hypothetical protein